MKTYLIRRWNGINLAYRLVGINLEWIRVPYFGYVPGHVDMLNWCHP